MPDMEKRKTDVSHGRLNDTPKKTEEIDRWKGGPHMPRSPSIFSLITSPRLHAPYLRVVSNLAVQFLIKKNTVIPHPRLPN